MSSGNGLSGWMDITLGECAEWFSGGTPSKSEASYWGGDIPWVSAKDMKTFRLYDTQDHVSPEGASEGARLVPPGAILILVRGMTLHEDVPICLAMHEMAFNQDVKAMVPKSNVDSQFLAYWLLAKKPLLLALVDSASHGTGRLRTDILQNLPVHLPSLSEQRSVVGIFGALDDKIELNRRMNETLEAIAWLTFESRLLGPVDGDPVGAWRSASIADIAAYVNGRNFTKNASESGRMVIRIAELNSGPGGSTVYNNVEADPVNIAYPDDVLFSWSGSLNVYRWNGDEALINQHIFKVVCDRFPKWFVYWHLRRAMPFFQEIASDKATTMGHIKREHLAEARLLIPPDDVIHEVSGVMEPLWAKGAQLARESRTLAAIRDTLLPKLISGELRVRDAERVAEQGT